LRSFRYLEVTNGSLPEHNKQGNRGSEGVDQQDEAQIEKHHGLLPKHLVSEVQGQQR
jgi:hypothetical protein